MYSFMDYSIVKKQNNWYIEIIKRIFKEKVKKMPNRIILNNVSYHGKGAIQAIPDEVRARGFKKALEWT